jgi:hypothetical protein
LIEYDPTNPDLFENYVPTSQRKRNRIIKGIIVVGITCLVIYLVLKEPDNDVEEDIFIS